MKKGFIFGLGLLLLFIMGCSKTTSQIITLDKNYYSFLSNQEMQEKHFIKKLSEYDTEISICFLDEDGYKHLYVFAVPIRYWDEKTGTMKLIDDRIANCKNTEDSTYTFEVNQSDFITKFPQTLKIDQGILLSKSCDIEYAPIIENESYSKYMKRENMLGASKYVIQYDNTFSDAAFFTYPTLLGTENEVIIKNRTPQRAQKFWFKIHNANPIVTDSGYILLRDEENNQDIIGIIQAPILVDSTTYSPNVSINNSLTLEEIEDDFYELTVNLDKDFLENEKTKYPVIYNLPVELRREKQPDTQVYSLLPNGNRYLSNCTLIGNDNTLGTGKCYVRFVLASLFEINPDNIKTVNYYTYSLNKNTAVFNEVLQDWCSLTTTWATSIKAGDVVAKSNKASVGVQTFNITTQAKKWFADQDLVLERYGLLMSSESDNSTTVLLSHDNALYNIRTEIVFK